MKATASNLIRWSGLAAIGAGVIFIGIQPIHPPDYLASVSTNTWLVINTFKTIMCYLMMLGLVGLYAKQVNEAGWLGLAGFLIFSLSWALQSLYTFTEGAILPLLVTESPKFVEGFLGIINGSGSEINIGALPTLYGLVGGFYILGALLFGIATFRAGVLPRWTGALLAFGAVLPIAGSLLPHPLDRIMAVPMGVALISLGYALWSDRLEKASHAQAGRSSVQMHTTAAK